MGETDLIEEHDDSAAEDDRSVLGPDERDRDLLDGTWEQKYYSGNNRSRDWNTIGIGIALMLLMGMILPTVLIALR
ncbi:MAG: hypothetical protein CL897_00660 [Dehalococcoidia bacterium]|nr:hypothetical protein [Dehalococcoidia bacterium]HCV00429.1 hypothetical protein [Dehalococcoidia bacterium]|tara:strand:- start:491 stop:718 length:228 start_codon:yes stop_codon:yes gene_type:complete